MKNKLFAFLAAMTAFISFSYQQVEATCAYPTLLLIHLSTAGVNSIVLSSNALGIRIDADITSSTTGGIDEELIGYIEWNATKNNTASQQIKMTQMEQWNASDPGAPKSGLFAAQQIRSGNIDTTDALIRMIAIKVYTNVNTTSTDTIIYIAPTQLISSQTTVGGTVWGANLTAPTTVGATYCGWIGVLSFYMVDDLANSVHPGTFIATMQLSIQS